MSESGKGKAVARPPSRLGKANSWSSAPAGASSCRTTVPGDAAFLARRKEARAARKGPTLDRSFTLNDLDEIEGFIGLGLDLDSPDLDAEDKMHELLPALDFYRTVTAGMDRARLRRTSSSVTAESFDSEAAAALTDADRRAAWKKYFDHINEPEMMKLRIKQWAKAVACKLRNSP